MAETAVPRRPVSMHVRVFMMTHNVKMHCNVHRVQSRNAMDARRSTCAREYTRQRIHVYMYVCITSIVHAARNADRGGHKRAHAW